MARRKTLKKLPKVTRKVTDNFILGQPSGLIGNVLPTRKDFVNCFRKIHSEIDPLTGTRTTVGKAVHLACNRVKQIWENEGIAIVCEKRITQMGNCCQRRFKKFMKVPKHRREDSDFMDRENSWFSKLFDIACCKCPDPQNCPCPREDKIPPVEIPFLQDQRSTRSLTIGSVDYKETRRRQAIEEIKKRRERQHARPKGEEEEADSTALHTEESSAESSSEPCAPSSSSLDLDGEAQQSEINTDSLQNMALAADRYGVSNRAAAAIVNGFQVDIGRVTANNTTYVVDHKKVDRARAQARKAEVKTKKEAAMSRLSALYFDGRKDTTLVVIGDEDDEIESTSYRRKEMGQEEHVSVVAEPGGEYLTHFTPATGKALDIFKKIQEIVNEYGGDVIVLGADGTRVNTGIHGGVCRLFELFEGRAVHWFICQLHSNELNLRELFIKVDGVSAGPKSFSGPIGKMLADDLEKKPVVSFVPLSGCVPDLDDQAVKDLSSDQYILYQLSVAITRGHIPQKLARRKIGPLNLARWLTLAARILRLYVSTAEPSNNLRMLTEFILKHYVPVWFQIKCHPYCKSGSKNLFRSVQLLRELPDVVQKIVRPVVQRNGFWAHPECILLGMLADDDVSIRKAAADRITECRSRDLYQEEPRPYHVPNINFQASSFTELIDWAHELITEPPLTHRVSADELMNYKEVMPRLPVHTQAVERSVHLVTQAAAAVAGQEARHAYVCARLRHRRAMPVFDSKGDFVLDC